MRKLVMLALIAALGLVAAGGAGASHRHAAGTAFSYCDNPTFPPMENATTGGKPTGFDIDFANALAKQMGGTAKYVFSSFAGLLPALGAKRCDVVISGIFITPDRTKQFPAVAYMHSHRALIVAGGNPKHITSPAGLKGKSAAVQQGRRRPEDPRVEEDEAANCAAWRCASEREEEAEHDRDRKRDERQLDSEKRSPPVWAGGERLPEQVRVEAT